MQRAYLEGLEADGTVSFDRDGEFPSEAEGGPKVRQAEVTADVIDITAMRAELEQQRGGES